MKFCVICKTNAAKIVRPRNRILLCLECFFQSIEQEVHLTIISSKMFKSGEKVVIGASGGKDSTVLIHILDYLNKKYNYGIQIHLLSIDEGIHGYRDDSLETVKKNAKDYNLALKIIPFQELFGWTMDTIVKQEGMKTSCTYCGVFRRQSLEKGAKLLQADKIVTGHNADDIAETLLMNVFRGDIQRMGKSTAICTTDGKEDIIPRCKPFKYLYEKEIVLYAHYKKLVYFSTECTYFPGSYRGGIRDLIKQLEVLRPSTIIDIIHSGEQMTQNLIEEKIENTKVIAFQNKKIKKQVWTNCINCKMPSSNQICKACNLLNQLNKGKPKIEINEEELINKKQN